ncbi:MAG: hypothetical protein ACOYI1_04630 [Caldicoprobacteraceae bacterium]
MAEKTSLINIGRAELDDNKTVWQVQQEYRKVFGKIVYGHPKGCFFYWELAMNTYWAGSE